MATMKGIVKKDQTPGAVWVEDLPVPEPLEGEVLVRIKAAAICGTDLHIYGWTPWAQARIKTPMVFGHEFAGEIVKVGPGVKRFSVGQRVAGETHIGCGMCYQCRSGNMHICESMKIVGVHVPGAFAEYITIPESCAWELGPGVSYEQGAFLEPMGVAMHGIQASLGVGGKDVVILGCGPIGLMATGIARSQGARQVVCSDIAEGKLDVAEVMGATTTVNSMRQDLSRVVMDATGGRGADIVIDYSGNGGAISDGLKSLKKGGRMVLVGLPDKPVSIDLTDGVIYKEATLVGVTGRTMYGTWFECEKSLSSGGVNLSPVVGGRFQMKDFEKAFQAIYDKAPGKMLLIP